MIALAFFDVDGSSSRPTLLTSTWSAGATTDQAAEMLRTVPSVKQAQEIAYERTRDFGDPWQDTDANGCDTRNDVLRRDLTSVTIGTQSNPCAVTSGDLVDPYSGQLIHFERRAATQVQIDHLIPLHAAWQLGAWRWSDQKRVAFANDPRELVAVSGAANQDKSDALANEWKPANRSIWCVYAINSIVVHHAYGLGATPQEAKALGSMLEMCPK